LKPILTPLCDCRNAGYRPARVVLAMRAMPLFMVDPEWAREHLLPQFDWNRDPDSVEALGAWMGFLAASDPTPAFLEAIRPSFLETARHFDQLDRYKQQYAGLLTVVALEGVDASQDGAIFSREELREAFRNLPAEGFAWAAVCLTQSLEKSGDQREVHWDQRVKPLLEEIWPKTRDKFTAQVSVQLARLFTATGPRFPEAMRDFGHWLVPVEHPDVVARRIQEKNLGSQHPEASLDLLDKVTGERQPVGWDDFRQCLDAIACARPNLAGDPRLTRLWECYRRYT
jgi:hypothetical protein